MQSKYNLIPLRGNTMGRKGLFSIPIKSGTSSVTEKINLLDDWTLYPLNVKLRIASYEGEHKNLTFNEAAKNFHASLEIPDSIKKYPFVEVRIEADRVILPAEKSFPVSMGRPDIFAR